MPDQLEDAAVADGPRHDRRKYDRHYIALCERITDLETSLAIVIKLLEEGTAAANLLCRVAAGVRFAFNYIVSPIALIVLAAYLLTGADVPDWFLRLERVFSGSGPRPRAVYVDLTRSDAI